MGLASSCRCRAAYQVIEGAQRSLGTIAGGNDDLLVGHRGHVTRGKHAGHRCAAMDKRFLIETPLMWIDKADTWALAHSLGGQPLVDLIIEHTHTCYLGDREHRHAWGYGCGECPACELRARGYERYKARL